MHLLKCENGHIYDGDKFRSCPHCSSIVLDRLSDPDTYGRNQADVDTEMPESEEREFYERIGKRRVAGMLLCVEGSMQGEGFFLREGENVIGRASNMDVALPKEPSISRRNHASIVYDIVGNHYTIQVMSHEAEVCLNGKQICGEYTLKDRDEIQLGTCRFIMIEAGELWQGIRNSKG